VRDVHGAHPVHRDAPDLRELADDADGARARSRDRRPGGATFALPWLKDAFANYASVAVLGETDPTGLHRVGTLAEATRELVAMTPHASKLGGRPKRRRSRRCSCSSR
jgi:hypothetical protein